MFESNTILGVSTGDFESSTHLGNFLEILGRIGEKRLESGLEIPCFA
jgi:hypothetical protein